MLAQYEEFKGLKAVTTDENFSNTKSAKLKGIQVYVKEFTSHNLERLIAEFIVSCFMAYALQGMDDAPEFPHFQLIADKDKLIGFYATSLKNDPTNITEEAAVTRFYDYLQAKGSAVHAAMRFLAADPDSVPNHGWDEGSISVIDFGLAFYKELRERNKLEGVELGKLPERDIFSPNALNLMQWLFLEAKGAESFSPFHAFGPNPTKLLPKNDTQQHVLKEFYRKYLHALTLLSNKNEILTKLRAELHAELVPTATDIFSRLENRMVAIKLLLAELDIERQLNEALPQATRSSEPVKAFFEKRVTSSGIMQTTVSQSPVSLREKENNDPHKNTSS